jgi:superfamily II DNA or RNA helicase
MIPELRRYQHETIEAIRQAIRDGHKRILVQIPTGGGKTLTGTSMLVGALAKGSRSLFVAHRLELIDQTVATFARLGVLSIGVIRAQDPRTDPKQPIQVASIQSLGRRQKPEARIVFIDEAHRSVSHTYVKHLFEAYPDAIFIGLTATPCRTDGKPLGVWWTAMVQKTTYSRLIEDGHLMAPTVYSTPVLPDLTSVRTTNGDYNAEDLEAAVNRRALIGNLLAEWLRHGSELRTVAFAVSVAHSKAIVEQFREQGVRAEHLDGTTPEDERRAILGRLESGVTRVVSNMGVLCEGWDMPSCKCMLLARPTKSLALYMQMAGRILRPFEGLTPIILDHGGNVDRHGLPHEDREWSLTDKPKKVDAMPLKACPECFAMIPASKVACPHCGHVFPKPQGEPPPSDTKALTHVELALRTLEGDDAQLTFFKALAKKAEERKWMPGAVNHKFEEKYGVLPPKHWYLRFKRAHEKAGA